MTDESRASKGDRDDWRVVDAEVNSDHRATLERILGHPMSANIEWRQARSLLEAVGSVTEEHNGKVKITVEDQTIVLRPPRGKDLDPETVVELRRLLTRAGLAPPGENA